MSTSYDIRRARRQKERERAAFGETLAEYHARERGQNGASIGAHLPRARDRNTPNLFTGLRRGQTTVDLFDWADDAGEGEV